MKVAKNILAVIGALSLVVIVIAICWWNGLFAAPLELDFEPVENPPRTRVAHVDLSPDDQIILQNENYDGFFGDGGGVVAARLAHPITYDSESWASIANLPAEFRSFLGSTERGGEYLDTLLNDSETIWCISKLQRNGEHISNLVLFFYQPSEQIVLEWIVHT